MKKLSIVLALALLLSLAGCGQASTGLLEGVTPAESGDAADAVLPVAAFAARLFSELYDGGDVLVSPVSVLAALAMAEAGAREDTLAQMEEAFGVDAETMRAALAAYMSSVEGTEAKIANSVWFNSDGSFEPNGDFLADCASFAGAEVFAREFGAAACRELNKWVSEHTDGMIDGILERVNSDDIMYLVNALAFEADWEEDYREFQLRDGVFHAADGDKTVQMMHSMENTYLECEGFTGFMKPYKGGRYAFAALLPDEDVGLDGLAASLTGDVLVAALADEREAGVETKTPVFSGEYRGDLSGSLKSMGMTDAFDSSLADFTGMGTTPLGSIFIGAVLHRTFIDVTPLGTRAGAASAVTQYGGIDRPEESVVLDRPFLYMIVDTEYNIPLFIGAMTGESL